MEKIEKTIYDIDKLIYENIEKLNSDRGLLAQNTLGHLRNFLEHIFLKIYFQETGDKVKINNYLDIQKSIKYINSNGKFREFKKFHKLLQISASHYTLDKENSERLMLKYLIFLYKIKRILKSNYNFLILKNLEKFPTDLNSSNREYYEKITECINLGGSKVINLDLSNERYYIQKIKPFFIGGNIYYEITFVRAGDKISKFDRIIAFTKLDILSNYAVKFKIRTDSIKLLGKKMPVNIIESWEISIRPCEFDNFIKIFGENKNIGTNKEVLELMTFLTKYNLTFVDIILLPKNKYENIKNIIIKNTKIRVNYFFDILDKIKFIIENDKPGKNILKYLLYNLNNKIIKLQYNNETCNKLTDLYLNWGVIPFDKMPFCTSLIGHNPKVINLLECIDFSSREHEFLTRTIKTNIENEGKLFTNLLELDNIEGIDLLITKYHSKLYLPKHDNRKIEKIHNYIYLKGYVEDVINIIKKLEKLSLIGLPNYSKSVIDWLENNKEENKIYDDFKKELLIKMFENSNISFIYGAAGTGKTTMINLVSNFFKSKKSNILYLANTHPAVDNLKRRVDEANDSNCKTIKKFISTRNSDIEYDLLILDECSTVSNEDMIQVLNKADFKLIILVGDIYQIEAIKFGNWFEISKNYFPQNSILELSTIFRTKNEELLELWKRVRKLDSSINEYISKNNYSVILDESIFSDFKDDEIILCLNYDGLYGVNNINKFLQLNNKNQSVEWGVHIYKIGDRILFNELANKRFDASVIYNNLKGKITNIEKKKDSIMFDIEIEILVKNNDSFGFELLEPINEGKSIIRFEVKKYESTDYENNDILTVVPFQIAYAVSIHKAQGLEYDLVKIVISDEVGEMITHNIFYTAITRARKELKIYWTPETQNKILESFKERDSKKDLHLLKTLMTK